MEVSSMLCAHQSISSISHDGVFWFASICRTHTQPISSPTAPQDWLRALPNQKPSWHSNRGLKRCHDCSTCTSSKLIVTHFILVSTPTYSFLYVPPEQQTSVSLLQMMECYCFASTKCSELNPFYKLPLATWNYSSINWTKFKISFQIMCIRGFERLFRARAQKA